MGPYRPFVLADLDSYSIEKNGQNDCHSNYLLTINLFSAG